MTICHMDLSFYLSCEGVPMDDMVKKWGEGVAKRGFAQIPNYLLLINNFIDKEKTLKPIDLLLLIELVGSWWKVEDQPFPSARTLAVRCGVSERQIFRSLSKLEEISLISKTKRRHKGIVSSNAYDLQPLVDVLAEIAKVYPTEFPRRIRKKGVSTSVDDNKND